MFATKKKQKNKTRNILCYNLLIDFGFVNFSSRFWSFFCFLHFALFDRLAHYNQDFHMHVCVNISIESTSLLIVNADASAVLAIIFLSLFKWKRNSSHRYTACMHTFYVQFWNSLFEMYFIIWRINKNKNDKLKLWIYAKCMNWLLEWSFSCVNNHTYTRYIKCAHENAHVNSTIGIYSVFFSSLNFILIWHKSDFNKHLLMNSKHAF